MNIGLRGVGFHNKGDELMIHAVVREVRSWPRFEMLALDGGHGTWKGARALGARRIATFQKHIVNLSWPAPLLPPPLGRQLGLMAEQDLDVMLDASGFSFGEPWSNRQARNFLKFLERWKRPDRQCVMLPQAFGPFRTPEMRRTFAELLRHVDLVFARETTSYEHLRDVAADDDRLRLAPDFTNLVEPVAPVGMDRLEGAVCLIPNYRMVDKTDHGDAYRDRMIWIARTLREAGRPFFLLVHEMGRGDLQLAREIATALDEPPEIVREPDARRLKGIIGRCAAVIGSRFHALVSALSQGVPVVVMGWSHKYDLLLADYRCESLLLRNMADDEIARAALGRILEPSRQEELRRTIAAAATEQKAKTRAMWQEVRDVLGFAEIRSAA